VADFKPKYIASTSLDVTNLHSLASSSSFTAGWESAAQNNETDLFIDALVSGKLVTGSSGTVAGQIQIWAYGSYNDIPDYPDQIDGTQSTETITDTEILASGLVLIKSIICDTTNSRTYPFGPIGIARFFGEFLPAKWGLFISHNLTAALASSGNAIFVKGVQLQSV
jgi:hypothetical protein